MAESTSIIEPQTEPQQAPTASQEMQQGPQSPQGFRQRTNKINVGETERYGSILGGVALILSGLARRGLGGLVLAGLGAAIVRRGVTGHCDLYQSIGVSTAPSSRPGVPDNLGTKVERTITVNLPREEVFRFWRNLRNFPQFMSRIQRVDVINDKRSHWVAKGPGGRIFEWDADIINEHPNELIAWETLPGAEIQNAGSVRFTEAPGGGTEIRLTFEYNQPGGKLGVLGMKLLGETVERYIEEDLGRLKQNLENQKGSAEPIETVGPVGPVGPVITAR